MAQERQLERKRTRRGLGARTSEGETTTANARGSRYRKTPGPGPSMLTKGHPHAPRAEQARRRTRRDNPEAARD